MAEINQKEQDGWAIYGRVS